MNITESTMEEPDMIWIGGLGYALMVSVAEWDLFVENPLFVQITANIK